MTTLMRYTALAAVLFVPSALAEDLLTQGDVYKPACDAEQWAGTVTALHSAAAGRQEKQLEGLAHAWLCEKGEAPLRKLLRAAPEKITVIEEATGEEGSRALEAREQAITLREGAAWGATVDIQPPDVTISILSDEACIQCLSFRFIGATWMVVRKEEACD